MTVKLKNDMVLVIEKAVKEDAQQVLDYLSIVGGESDNLLFGAGGFPMTVEAEEQLIERLQGLATSAMFVGRIDGEVVSVCSFSSPTRERIAHQAELALSVKKKYWGLSVGTHLMQTSIDFARGNGVTQILHLGVKADNAAAIALYRKMGFEPIGVYKSFFKIDGRYYDEILMNLYL